MSNNEQSTSNANNESEDLFEEFGGNNVNYNHLFETVTCFASRDEAFEWAQKIAFDNGFALIKASNGAKNRKQPELLGSYFRCSRANDINGKELIVWNILTSEKGGYHNHKVTKYKDGHRHFAGLNAEEKEFVRQQVRASISPRDIKNGLHQRTPDKPQPTSTQIYSVVNKFRREVRGTRNTARQMLAVAVAANYMEWHKTDSETKELSHVFMAHPEAVKLFRAYPHVVLIDSTYKTNVYKIALVEVVGVTPCGSSFLIATVLLPSESEDDYGWMLLRLGELLSCTGSSISAFVTDREMGLIAALESLHPSTPHLLCRWHINRAMEKQALSKENFMWYKDIIMHSPKSGWYRVINASTIDEFRSAWECFSEKWEEMALYVISTWGKYRKKFVNCYTNQYFHLGNTATSRVESSHSLLKAWLKSNNLNLDTMWFRIHSMLEALHSKIRYELEVSRSRPRNGDRVFSLLQENVSINAIEIMEEEIKRGIELGNVLEEHCGCVLRVTHGLPCACALIQLQRTGKRVHLDDVHAFWRTLEYGNIGVPPKTHDDELEKLFEEARACDPAKKRVIIEKLRDGLHPEDEEVKPPPVRENPKGRPRGSTTRNKSGFEHARKKPAKVSTPATTFVQHTVGDFDQGPVGAPLESGYNKGFLSTWTKKYAVPEEVRDFFDGWVDVGNDGHCGYRVVSHVARGRESDHLVMREWCIREIKAYEFYKDFLLLIVVCCLRVLPDTRRH
ncbi:uncharacterized protein LOC141588240 [Silene latifolia]|uniref:uncharacterized protein LOC141588240 n=1 Tax=Silene latifolia TaxID=37657 RepID=UPI003D77A253